jgi:arylformamidase
MILLSHVIDSNTPTYGNRDKFFVDEVSKIADGASANSSKWVFSTNHLGTHIDMPKHFFDDGATLTDVPLDFWFSKKIQLVDVICEKAILIDVDHITEKVLNDTEVLLIRTGYEKYRSSGKYWTDNPGLAANLGKYLRQYYPKIRIVGFDFLSLTSWKYRDEGKFAHQTFLDPVGIGNPVCIIEDMKLNSVNKNINNILVSPLFSKNSNGSPVSVFADLL